MNRFSGLFFLGLIRVVRLFALGFLSFDAHSSFGRSGFQTLADFRSLPWLEWVLTNPFFPRSIMIPRSIALGWSSLRLHFLELIRSLPCPLVDWVLPSLPRVDLGSGSNLPCLGWIGFSSVLSLADQDFQNSLALLKFQLTLSLRWADRSFWLLLWVTRFLSLFALGWSGFLAPLLFWMIQRARSVWTELWFALSLP